MENGKGKHDRRVDRYGIHSIANTILLHISQPRHLDPFVIHLHSSSFLYLPSPQPSIVSSILLPTLPCGCVAGVAGISLLVAVLPSVTCM